MNTISKITSASLAETVFEEIQEAIVKGNIPHGSKISEPELAKKYGVSRGPLREAIRRLQGRKLVVHTRNAGVRVVSLSQEKLLEIYDVREGLEGMAARLAAVHMDDQDIDYLRQLTQQYANPKNSAHGLSYFQDEADLEFHYRIIQGSRNSKLIDMLNIHLLQIIKMYRYQFTEYSNRMAANVEEHCLILEAIERRDPEVAEILMRRHVSGIRESLKQSLH